MLDNMGVKLSELVGGSFNALNLKIEALQKENEALKKENAELREALLYNGNGLSQVAQNIVNNIDGK